MGNKVHNKNDNKKLYVRQVFKTRKIRVVHKIPFLRYRLPMSKLIIKSMIFAKKQELFH